MPASPVSKTTCPCPALTCSQRSRRSVTSDSRPTSGVSPLVTEPHQDALWLHFPGGRGTRGEAQLHLGVSVLLSPHSQNTPGLNDRSLSLIATVLGAASPSMRRAMFGHFPQGQLFLTPCSTHLPDHDQPSMDTQTDSELDTFVLLQTGIEVSHGSEDTQTQYVPLVGHHLHGRGDSQSTRGVHPLGVGQCVHHSAE